MDRETLLVLLAIHQVLAAQTLAMIRLSENNVAGFREAMARVSEKIDDLDMRLSKFLPS